MGERTQSGRDAPNPGARVGCRANRSYNLVMNPLETLDLADWGPAPSGGPDDHAAAALESGKVLFLPRLAFVLGNDERRFLSPEWSSGKAKNISYDPATGAVRGTDAAETDRAGLGAMMGRYAQQTRELVARLCPRYAAHLVTGRTSFRPVEIAGRSSSVTKDDTRLHVDAFASQPVHGKRILRVFSNIDPAGKPRRWEVGDAFESWLPRFAPRLPRPVPGSAWLMHRIGVTKSRRTAYDHFMLQLHDAMKRDGGYQSDAPRTRVEFPAGSTWIVFTDRVAHAALAGQFALEQTFYLPVSAMQREEFAPLRILERHFHAALA